LASVNVLDTSHHHARPQAFKCEARARAQRGGQFVDSRSPGARAHRVAIASARMRENAHEQRARLHNAALRRVADARVAHKML